MLTGFQVSTGAYSTEHGELLCESCFDRGDTYARPVSNYELDEWQSALSGDLSYEDGHSDECYCEGAVYCDGCSNELREAFDSPGCPPDEEEEDDESDPAFD